MLKIVWNLLLIGLVLFVSLIGLRRIIPQFTHADSPLMITAGLEGVGVLVCVLAACSSLASPFWFRSPVWLRLIYAVLLAGFIAGVLYIERTVWQLAGPQYYVVPTVDYVSFFGTYLVFTLPHFLFGCGYPALLSRFLTRRNGSLTPR